MSEVAQRVTPTDIKNALPFLLYSVPSYVGERSQFALYGREIAGAVRPILGGKVVRNLVLDGSENVRPHSRVLSPNTDEVLFDPAESTVQYEIVAGPLPNDEDSGLLIRTAVLTVELQDHFDIIDPSCIK